MMEVTARGGGKLAKFCDQLPTYHALLLLFITKYKPQNATPTDLRRLLPFPFNQIHTLETPFRSAAHSSSSNFFSNFKNPLLVFLIL
ncbi:hypothetical protein L1987_16694 [Smallanthus sonchifolius]|uniref:Uncharacterized protein n=1 Tax=Smallanthus sonchifolius TaxID=185202 RepID=A0ACB9IVD0_9ASTR|nr:hypothetical protein L1987_16694 [Smallanthus sonchifolius]